MQTETETHIYVRTRFIGMHHWPGAPENVGFLRTLHRHEFHVKLSVRVTHGDRDVEFFTLQEELNRYIRDVLLPQLKVTPSMSCEMMAQKIIDDFSEAFDVVSCDVSEDGENGALVITL